jgi:hypothetical protein
VPLCRRSEPGKNPQPSPQTEQRPVSHSSPNQPNPQSQSFSRGYGSDLPTSLTYINLSTRGCSPRRPDADMGTNQCEGAVPSPWILKLQTEAARTPQETRRSFGIRPSLRATRFTRPSIPLTRKDNSSRPFGRILQVGFCLATR